jgi:multidrug efflux pump subunit AcrA (membrane-fusion protein)
VLSSKATGQIQSVHVREGDRVRQGQLLVEIESLDASARLRGAQAGEAEARMALEETDGDIRSAGAALRAAEAQHELADATRTRYDMLLERRAVSQQEYDEVESRLKAAVSEVERAREALAATESRRSQALARIERTESEAESARVIQGYAKILSPIDGIVTARHAEVGMLAGPGMPLVEVGGEDYQLEAMIEETRAGRIAAGQRVRVEIDAAAASVDGRVSLIVPASDPGTRTYIVKLDLLLPPPVRGAVRSGFFGRAFFSAEDREALVIPESSLVKRGQLTGVFVVRDEVALLRLVKTGKSYASGIEILSGLDAGARIVDAPTAEVTDGVRIVESVSSENTP